MCTVAVAVFGLLAGRELPVDLLPDLSYPTLTIQTVYPDAAPVSVERFVTRPVEEAVGVIQGVRDLRSTSRAGLSEVVLELEWGEPLDLRALDVREKLGAVELPREAEAPRVLRYDPGLDPVLRLALSAGEGPDGAPALEEDELRRLADRFLKPRLEAVRGVAAARVRGGRDPEIVVEADEERLAAQGLTLADLATALRAADVNQPAGTLEDMGAVFLVRTVHELRDLETIRATVVREDAGGRVRIGDVAAVRRSGKDQQESTREGGRETVELAVHREGQANALAVSAAVRAELEALRGELRAGLSLTVLSDQSGAIALAVNEVQSAALLGGLLTVLVLWFFLRDPRATAVVALTIPVSVVATFLLMRQARVSLNVMSLGGLALGIGMLVDNSIVVLEAIDRRRRQGLDRLTAALRGAGEVAAAVTASTLTTVAVFFPVVFVHGVAGQLFRDLALTVCASLLASLAVSLTLMPALAGLAGGGEPGPTPPEGEGERDAPPEEREQERLVAAASSFGWSAGPLRIGPVWLPPPFAGRGLLARAIATLLLPLRLALLLLAVALLGAAWALHVAFHGLSAPLARLLEGLGRAYPPLLVRALAVRTLVLLLGALLFVGALLLVPRLPTQLLPELNRGEFAFRLRWPEGTPLETTRQVLERIEAPLLADPRFERVFSVAGSLPAAGSGRQTLGENLAQLDLVLRPEARGDAAAEAEAVERVRQVLLGFPGVVSERVQPTLLSLAPPVEVLVYADDLELLDQATAQVEQALAGLSDLDDVGSTREPGSPEVRVELDRERAAALGVAAEALGEAMRRQIRGEVVAQLRESEDRIDLRLRSAQRFRARASQLGDLRVPLPAGGSVAISAVARVEEGRGPAAIHRSSGARVARVTASAPARDLGRVQAEVRAALAGLALPEGAVAELAGQDQELSASLDSLRAALALAVFLVFVVLAVQFESLLQPFVVLLTVPLAVVGVVGALVLTGTPLGVLPLMGTVVLAGIAVNNSIVLVDAINRRRREGQPLDTALVGAGRERLRPILMTTLTTVLALLPMALGGGSGSELRGPLAVTLLGGLLVSTVLTLLVTPCTYRVLVRSAEPAA